MQEDQAMRHIFIFGGSTVNGVGDPVGGWAAKFKNGMHTIMYGEDPAGEVVHIYELGVPGDAVKDILKRFDQEVFGRIRGASPDRVYIILAVGMNDSKAVDEEDAYLTTSEKFSTDLRELVDKATGYSRNVIGLGMTPVDEKKTKPRINPTNGRHSYFTNARISEFEDAAERTFEKAKAKFIPCFRKVPDDWLEVGLSEDGLHPGDAGHNWIRTQIEPVIASMLLGKL